MSMNEEIGRVMLQGEMLYCLGCAIRNLQAAAQHARSTGLEGLGDALEVTAADVLQKQAAHVLQQDPIVIVAEDT